MQRHKCCWYKLIVEIFIGVLVSILNLEACDLFNVKFVTTY